MAREVPLPISGPLARSLFTLIYTVVFLILGHFAKACYETTIQLSLLRGDKILLNRALGWRNGIQVLTAWRTTGFFPMRWWYPVMLFLVLASYTTHYLTNTIEDGSVYSICRFTQGLVMDRYSIMSRPSPSSVSLDYTADTQILARNSSPPCAVGIYSKIPNDYGLQKYQFCPQTPDLSNWDRSDVLGAWSCLKSRNLTFKAATTPDVVVLESQNSGGLYNNNNYAYFDWSRSLSNGTEQYNQIVIWSASISSNVSNVPWSIKFAIQTNPSWSEAPFNMDYYNCSLYSNSSMGTVTLNTIQSTIDSGFMINEWVRELPRYLYSGSMSYARSDVATQMEMLLNSIIMISGSDDYLFSVPTGGDDQYYGCLFNGSLVPEYVIAYMAFSMALCVLFIVWYSAMRVRLHELKRNTGYVQFIPADLSTWAALAVHFSAGGHGPTQGDAEKMSETTWTRDHLRDQYVKLRHNTLVIYRGDEQPQSEVYSPQGSSMQESRPILHHANVYTVIPGKAQ